MSTQFDYNAKIYMEQGSTKLCAESGAEIELQSGAVVDEQAGASVKAPIELNSSADKAMNCNGLSIIRSTIANTHTLARARAGVRKTIVSFSTFTQTIRGASAVGVRFGSTANVFYSLSITGTTKTKARGSMVQLQARSSAVWIVTFRSTALCAFSTACT